MMFALWVSSVQWASGTRVRVAAAVWRVERGMVMVLLVESLLLLFRVEV